ncbi:MAG: T9SS type A sorting domain-containing protein, partial [Rhodothermales bacterium]|nr:T9SS type A sorting domain-containing protein [Rhodothermales bacterium]
PYSGQLFAATPQGVYAQVNGKLELFGQGSQYYDIRTIAFMGETIFAGTWGRGVLAYNAATGVWQDAGFGDLPVLAFAVVEDSQTLVIGTSGSGIYLGHGLALSAGTSTSTEEASTDVPDGFNLKAAYPNPFNPQTTIPFELSESVNVHLAVYDLLGREISVLVDGLLPAGQHRVTFEAGQVPSGTYLIRMSAGGQHNTMPVTLIK